jgi:hypothetical protein
MDRDFLGFGTFDRKAGTIQTDVPLPPEILKRIVRIYRRSERQKSDFKNVIDYIPAVGFCAEINGTKHYIGSSFCL